MRHHQIVTAIGTAIATTTVLCGAGSASAAAAHHRHQPTAQPSTPAANARTAATPEALPAGSAWVTAGAFTRVYDPTPAGLAPCVAGSAAAANAPYYYENDHTFIQDPATGNWHLYGIYHEEPADPGGETTIGHAVSTHGPNGPYTTAGAALTAVNQGVYHEEHLWAPDVIAWHGTYYMFYAGGDALHPGGSSTSEINLATSTDLTNWTRLPSGPLFTDGYEARDPDVVRVGDQWVMYYDATSIPTGGNHVVEYRTSTDLVHWSTRGTAFTSASIGTSAGDTESPFVVHRDGWYYLFIGPRLDYVGTDVFASRNPYDFNGAQQVGHIPSHAAEVIQDPTGNWWISSAGWGQCGVYLAPLTFHDAPINGDHLYALASDKSSVWEWTGIGTVWTRIGGPASAIYAGGAGLFATDPNTGDIWRYTGQPMNWERVGGPGTTFAVNSTGLYGLNPAGVWQWSGNGTDWTKIGNPSPHLYTTAANVFATDPNTGDIWRYVGGPMNWERVGGPGTTFAGNAIGLYGLNGNGVQQWNGDRPDGSTDWSQIGGPAAATIIAGGNDLYELSSTDGTIWRHDTIAGSWTQIGTAGQQYTVADNTVYGRDQNGVWRYSGTPGTWNEIGLPAAQIATGN